MGGLPVINSVAIDRASLSPISGSLCKPGFPSCGGFFRRDVCDTSGFPQHVDMPARERDFPFVIQDLRNLFKAACNAQIQLSPSRIVFHPSCVSRLVIVLSLFTWCWLPRRDKFLVLFYALDNIFGAWWFLPAWNYLRTNLSSSAPFGLPEQVFDLQMIDNLF